MKRNSAIFAMFLCAQSVVADAAFAGAWGKNQGEFEIIIEGFALSQSETTDRGAVEIYSERGFGRGLSIVSEANIQLEEDRTVSTISAHSIKYARPFNGNWSVAAMLGADLKITDIDAQTVQLGPTARVMLGRGFSNGAWVNGEIGARERDEGISYFGEFGVGKRFKNNDLIMLKYITEGGYLSNFGSNLQISYAKSITKNWKIDFGYRESVGNNSRLRNSGFLFGIWWQK